MGEVLGAHNPTTIREHLEWIASGHVNGNPLGWIVDATKHAAAALAILDNADTLPWCDDGSIHPIVRLVPDPDPGVGAEHAPDYSAIWECRACRDTGEVWGLPLELGTPHGTVATLSLDRDGLEWLVHSLSNQYRDEAVEEMRRALSTIDERIAARCWRT